MDKKSFSLICAVVTSVLWGSAFVAQDMGMDFIGPHTFNVGRFLIGFLTLVPFFFILFGICFSHRSRATADFFNLYRCSKHRCFYSLLCFSRPCNFLLYIFKKNALVYLAIGFYLYTWRLTSKRT